MLGVRNMRTLFNRSHLEGCSYSQFGLVVCKKRENILYEKQTPSPCQGMHPVQEHNHQGEGLLLQGPKVQIFDSQIEGN